MVQPQTILKVADNTGAKTIMCIRVLGGSKRKSGSVGDIIVASVKTATPGTTGAGAKGKVVHAVIVRTTKEITRKDGTHICFDDNAAVILSKDNVTPEGTRIFGPVARELRDRGFLKICSLAVEVL